MTALRCTETCPEHPTAQYVHFCAACRGSIKTPKAAKASKANGKKGGRPKGATTGGAAARLCP